jgi:hypothetical protein
MRAAIAFFVATALTAAPAFAQDDDTDGLYFAGRALAGWRFNRLVAVRIERVDFESSGDARDALNVLSTQVEGFAPSVVGTVPLGPLEVFARAGVFWYDVEIERNEMSFATSRDRDTIFGAGVGVTIAEGLNLRAEYEVVEIDGLESPNAVWVRAAWRF